MTRLHVALVAGLSGSMVGCGVTGLRRMNAPPQGTPTYPAEAAVSRQRPFVTMVDNALLSEMAVFDVHFVPHTAELNGLGERRLARYATLLKHYGGTLRFDSTVDDEDLADQRMAQVREFLTIAGVEEENLDVVRGIPGGQGMLAVEAADVAEILRGPQQVTGRGGGAAGGGGGSGLP